MIRSFKIASFLIFSTKKSCRGNSLEASLDASNEFPQQMFSLGNNLESCYHVWLKKHFLSNTGNLFIDVFRLLGKGFNSVMGFYKVIFKVILSFMIFSRLIKGFLLDFCQCTESSIRIIYVCLYLPLLKEPPWCMDKPLPGCRMSETLNLGCRPYLCFISFLYFDLYVLGDVALIS